MKPKTVAVSYKMTALMIGGLIDTKIYNIMIHDIYRIPSFLTPNERSGNRQNALKRSFWDIILLQTQKLSKGLPLKFEAVSFRLKVLVHLNFLDFFASSFHQN